MGLFQLPFSGEELVEKYRKLDSMPQLGAEENVETKVEEKFSSIQFLNTYTTFPATGVSPLIVGKTYEVVIGTKVYDVIATDNATYGATLETSDFVFHYGKSNNHMILIRSASLLGVSSISIRLRTTVIAQIEDQYIPDTVVRKKDLEESVKNYVDEAILGGEW